MSSHLSNHLSSQVSGPLFSDAAHASAGSAHRGRCSAVVGLQWGDEGKGKLVDLLAANHDAVVRYNGGANAGHSVVVGGTRYSLHLVPSGILYPGKAAVIGNGVVVDPWKLNEEVVGLRQRGIDPSGLVVSDRAHVVLPYHKHEDGLREDLLNRGAEAGSNQSKIGTTRRGIGPAYADKAHRAGAVRMGDLLRPDALRERLSIALALKKSMLQGLSGGLGADAAADFDLETLYTKCLAIGKEFAPMIKDTTHMLHSMLAADKAVLFEGANGSLLDVDHGTYPYVTGSSCIASGIGTGTGVPATRLTRITGVMKAYTTRVGSGPMPTELHDNIAHTIRERGREYGTTTGRPRRVGWLDLMALRYSVMINGATDLALTMLDVLSGLSEVKACTGYTLNGKPLEYFTPDALDLARVTPVFTTFPGWSEDISNCKSRRELPANARSYVEFIEKFAGVPARFVSVGPGREQTIIG
ncbi:MAG: adenylosuccinate synthase [Phycisphaerales bacterium]